MDRLAAWTRLGEGMKISEMNLLTFTACFLQGAGILLVVGATKLMTTLAVCHPLLDLFQ